MGVSKLGIIGGLLVLLMMAVVACDEPEPTATPSTVPPSTVTTAPTVTSTKDSAPTPMPLSVEAVAEATAASMRALKSAHIEADIKATARATGEEEGTVEMSMTGDYQAPDRTRLSISLTIQGNVFEANYITIANKTYIQILDTDIWQVSDSSDGLDLRETLRFDPDGMENLALVGEGELDGEDVYHLKGFLASDAGGLLNSVPGSLVIVTPMGEVIVGVEFWIGVEDFLVRRTIQNIYMELSSDTGEGGELSLELDMRLSNYGDSVDIKAPNMESMSGTGASESQAVSTTVAAPAVSGANNPTQPLGDVEYSAADLAAWYEDVMDVVFQVPGIVWTDLDEGKNRIEIRMYPRRGGSEEMEVALATLDVPREAIVIDVGCEGIRQWPLDHGETPDEAFLSAIDHSLELVSQTPYGETVQMKLSLRNVSDEPVSFSLGGRPPYDFVVSVPNGEQVWHWKCAKIVEEPLDRETLGPGEELEFLGEWEQVDNRGEPVPPGSYLVHGMLNLDPPEKLATEAHELEVQVPADANHPSPTTTPTPIPIPADSRGRPKAPPHGQGAEIGTAYPYALYVHCGIRDARFDGRLWMADPMLSDGSGNPPVDWVPDDSVGVMELVRDDLAVLTAKSGRVVEFKPWPPNVEWRPCA